MLAIDGSKHPIKSIQVVPADSSEPRQSGLAAGKTLKQKVAGGELSDDVAALLTRRVVPVGVSKIANLLKEELRLTGRSYDEVLTKIGGRIIDVIRLNPALRLHGKTPESTRYWYYVSLADARRQRG